MKVGILNATYAVGSTGYLAQELADTLMENGIEVYAYWAIKNNNCSENDHIIRIGNTLDHKAHALLYRIFNNQGFNSRHATKVFCKHIKKAGINILQFHNLHSNYIDLKYLLRFCKKNNIAINIILHDCWFFTGLCPHFYPYEKCMQWKTGCTYCPIKESKLFRKQVAKIYERKMQLLTELGDLLYITAGTKWVHELGKESFLSSTPNHFLINDWVDLSVFKQLNSREKVLCKYGLDPNKKLCLAVAQTWDSKKGIETLLAIGNKFKDEIEIVALGNPNGYEVNKNINFLGYTSNRQELVDLYFAADIVANTSRMETFGLVTVEAMACGTPVIAYDNTGTSELIPSECGWLIEDGNIAEFLQCLSYALETNLNEIGIKCKMWVEENFDKNIQTKKYVELFHSMESDLNQRS